MSLFSNRNPAREANSGRSGVRCAAPKKTIPGYVYDIFAVWTIHILVGLHPWLTLCTLSIHLLFFGIYLFNLLT